MPPLELGDSKYFMPQGATDAKRIAAVDRNDISGLHAAGSGTGRQPANHRDASGMPESQIRCVMSIIACIWRPILNTFILSQADWFKMPPKKIIPPVQVSS